MELADQIPGLREAIERERFDRSAAFLGIPETVCGVELRPLTLLDVLRLDCVGSPFVVGGGITATDIGAFIKLQATPRNRLAMWRTLRRLGRTTTTREAAIEIIGFIEDSFADSPPVSAGGSGPVYWTIAQANIHTFGEAYGWTPETTLNQPLKVLFPQLNILRSANNPNAPLFNPRSDKVRGEWLAQQNRN